MGEKQHLLGKEVVSHQITKFRKERIIPLYKDETWSADLIDKSSLTKHSNNYKFILTVIHIFTPMFINGDGNWVNIINGAVVTYKNNVHSTINMTPVDASNNPDKLRYIISTSTKFKPKLKVGD